MDQIMNEVTIRNATRSDSEEIAGVLLDFYNMDDSVSILFRDFNKNHRTK
mgnify:CR=1 FL=1